MFGGDMFGDLFNFGGSLFDGMGFPDTGHMLQDGGTRSGSNNNHLMMSSPFAGGGDFLSPSLMFRDIEHMMAQTHGRMLQGASHDAAGVMSRMDGSGSPGGFFHSQVMVTSSSRGADGKMHTKRYVHSDRGDLSRGVREVREALDDPAAEQQRAMHFRQLGDRAHRVDKRRNVRTGHVDSYDEVRGFERQHLGSFDSDWTQRAGHFSQQQLLPQQQQQQQPRQQAICYPGQNNSSSSPIVQELPPSNPPRQSPNTGSTRLRSLQRPKP